jgi:hypothetical protein
VYEGDINMDGLLVQISPNIWNVMNKMVSV